MNDNPKAGILVSECDFDKTASNTVLVAEDDPICRRVLQSRLRNWGFRVIIAEDGLEAWEIIQEDNAPDLLILDWMMPGIDGLELCRRIRRRRHVIYPYILLVTGKDDTQDVVRGLEAGADDYLSKPFDPTELRARLQVGKRILTLQHELIEAREELRFQADHDALTGILSRAAILHMLDHDRPEARHPGGLPGRFRQKAGPAWLDQLTLPQPYAESDLAAAAGLPAHHRDRHAQPGDRGPASRLLPRPTRWCGQLPGIGPVLAAVIVAGIGDVTRFPDAGPLCYWAGLTPRHRESDTKVARGHVTKQGSPAAALGADQGHPAHPQDGQSSAVSRTPSSPAAEGARNIAKVRRRPPPADPGLLRHARRPGQPLPDRRPAARDPAASAGGMNSFPGQRPGARSPARPAAPRARAPSSLTPPDRPS